MTNGVGVENPDPRGGLIYDPLTGTWSLGPDLDVNYMAAAARPRGETTRWE